MIITQTPYRVSFAGGGTDLPSFYQKEIGAVFSVALNKHMYVTLSYRFEPSTRVAYSKTEICDTVDEIQHTIVREALRYTDLGRHLEITTIGDVPAGTGMGSSSTLTVGLLNALHAYKGDIVNRHKMAEEACHIEIDVLKKPIGRQDQYAAAFGGFNYLRFNPDHHVDVEPVPCRVEMVHELEQRILLLYTNQKRCGCDPQTAKRANRGQDVDPPPDARPGRCHAAGLLRPRRSGRIRKAPSRRLGTETIARIWHQ
jgi:D-glycero-alpha-D-manno-heptose-7-phosphate kinase